MKLSQYVQRVSTLDDFTLRHLRRWCGRYAPTAEDPDTVCARMVVFLESLSKEDRDFYAAHGWTKAFDAMTEIESRHAGEQPEEP